MWEQLKLWEGSPGYGSQSQQGVGEGSVWHHHLIILEAMNVQTEPLGLGKVVPAMDPHTKESQNVTNTKYKGLFLFCFVFKFSLRTF